MGKRASDRISIDSGGGFAGAALTPSLYAGRNGSDSLPKPDLNSLQEGASPVKTRFGLVTIFGS
jgi:hypothetical protein